MKIKALLPFIVLSTLPLIMLSVVITPKNIVKSESLNDNLRKQADLKKKISDSQNQEKTLSSQLAYFNDQIALTQLQIEATQNQINQLNEDINSTSDKISNTQNQINTKTALVNGRIKAIYEGGGSQPFEFFLTTNDFNSYLNLQKYSDAIHQSDLNLLKNLKNTKANYENQKADLTNQKQQAETLSSQLQNQENSLSSQQSAENNLLNLTKNNESSYQSQLASAQAEEKSLEAFANARVGSGGSILAHVNLSDSWGTYYNQRDSYWGNIFIGNSQTTIWEVGCLITSVAMVFSHYGDNDTTPGIIGANPANFWGSTASMLIPGPVPSGHKATYLTGPSLSYLKSQISADNPVILGMSWSGNEHWVVARGLDSNGNIMINDPWYDRSMNVPLSVHYSTSYIYAARVYN